MTKLEFLPRLRRVFSLPPEPVELVLACSLFVRAIGVLIKLNLTAQPVEPLLLFPGYIVLALFHCGAVLANDGKTRRVCLLLQALVWSGLSVQFAVVQHELVTSFPVFAVFAVWAYLRIGLALAQEEAERKRRHDRLGG